MTKNSTMSEILRHAARSFRPVPEVDPCDLMANAGMTAVDAWQRELLTERPFRSLLLCSRQSGKSTVAACLALA